MNTEIYDKVYRLALKDFRNRTLKGMYPYLQVLDDILSYTTIASKADLGLVDIPLDQIAGTKTAGRTNAFASNFMPLLGERSEFGAKWAYLYDHQIQEGIHDPIMVYEVVPAL